MTIKQADPRIAVADLINAVRVPAVANKCDKQDYQYAIHRLEQKLAAAKAAVEALS